MSAKAVRKSREDMGRGQSATVAIPVVDFLKVLRLILDPSLAPKKAQDAQSDGAQDEGLFHLVSRQIYRPKNGSANDFYRNVNEPISALLKTVNQIVCDILSR